MKYDGEENTQTGGTWVEKDGKYELTMDEVTQVATLNGNTLTITHSEGSASTTMVFKK